MKSQKDHVLLTLIKENFIVKALTGCCDMVARKNDKILLIKVLEDANAMTGEAAAELSKTAAAIRAAPLIIGERANTKLKDDVVYTRYQIPTITIATFRASLKNTPLVLISKKSGIVAQLHGAKVREQREKEDLSRGRLSRQLGISTRMLSKYEQSNAELSVQHAAKVYDLFGNEVFKRIEIFSALPEQSNPLSSEISFKYHDLGFNVTETRKVPFDVVAQKENTLILTKIGDNIHHDLNNISHAIGANDLAIVSKKKPAHMPALTKEEFLEFEKASALIKFIQEYQ